MSESGKTWAFIAGALAGAAAVLYRKEIQELAEKVSKDIASAISEKIQDLGTDNEKKTENVD